MVPAREARQKFRRTPNPLKIRSFFLFPRGGLGAILKGVTTLLAEDPT